MSKVKDRRAGRVAMVRESDGNRTFTKPMHVPAMMAEGYRAVEVAGAEPSPAAPKRTVKKGAQ
jgi:hypothetical protein